MLTKRNIIVSVLFVMVSGAVVFAEEFPHRKDFADVPCISSQELKAKYDKNDVVIIDVRAKIEFDVIHINKSLHVPVAYANFADVMGKLIKESPQKTYAFYCNGITCLKSYEAAQKTIKSGCKNCVAYDAGIAEWSKRYPADTIVMGRVIANAEKQLISDSEFNKRLIDFDAFKKKAMKADAIVIDVRDHIQSTGKLPGIENAKVIPLDTFIPNFVAKKTEQDKTLLIFDQVGKQVKWLMYYLRDNGYTNYFFLDKGATEVLKKQEYK